MTETSPIRNGLDSATARISAGQSTTSASCYLKIPTDCAIKTMKISGGTRPSDAAMSLFLRSHTTVVGRRNLTHKIASATVSIAATTTRNRSITTYNNRPAWGVCDRPPNIVGKRRNFQALTRNQQMLEAQTAAGTQGTLR